MADLICASSLSQLPELIEEHDGDARAMLARVGVDPAVLGAYDRFVPFTALSTIIGLCAAEFGVPDFGLRLAARQDPDILGPVAIAARNAETVGDSFRQISAFAHVYSPAITAQMHYGEREVAYEFDTVLQRVPYRPHVVELAMGVTRSTFHMTLGHDFRANRITLAHPAMSDPRVYTDYFGCPVEFEAPANLVVFPRGVMQQTLRRVDALAYDVAIRFMTGHDRETAFVDAVSQLIVRALPAGAATLDAVSKLLMMHPRAVQRGLADAGATFEQLVDDARRELAVSLLANRGVPLSAVARQIGYSEQSTLTRSCRRWFGLPPLAKRRELTAPGQDSSRDLQESSAVGGSSLSGVSSPSEKSSSAEATSMR
ncbi:AraC family transcriptional regulator [Gordonia sp. KTR9]|uniref:AraC family transcriptional regulator n=1 Tax=Gordonia sp. KTR9 TaxID=337191 RepID=UPI00027DDC4C|nr:AraC family transcriptional regulator [Gordonia sp. KTR9]AFR47663.1 AraC-type DNA-binding domain-containing protein [Gordonia sp. KTR9]